MTLVPNREILQQVMAEHFLATPDGSVAPEPALFMFSSWVEQHAVRLRRLLGMPVPATLDALSGLLLWLDKAPPTAGSQGRGFTLNAARQAQSADRLLRQWHASKQLPWLEERFFAWRASVHARLDDELVFDAEDWISDLIDLLDTAETSQLNLPRSIETRGFAELTPLERRLFECLERHQVVVKSFDNANDAQWPATTAFESPEQEIQAAIRWAQQAHAAGARRIALVMPSSHTVSGRLSRLIRKQLADGFPASRAAESANAAYFIPGCRPLAAHGAFQDALALLELSLAGVNSRVDFPLISQWLLSPHWAGSSEEASARALLELRLRRHGMFRLSLTDILLFAKRHHMLDSLPLLAARIEQLQSLESPGNAGAQAWQYLHHWEWPGPASSAELSRVADRVSTMLEHLALLPDPLPGLDQDTLLLLQKMAEETMLGFGGGPLSPVQVLSPAVAAAGRFDAIWVCNLDESNWPPPITPNPLLPAASRSAIPRMNPDGQFAHYHALTRKLCAAAGEVHLSWSKDAGEGPRGRSGILQAAPANDAPDKAPDPAVLQPPELESINDTAGFAYDRSGPIRIPGGAGFFSRQAACPLWAYLAYRLGADFPAAPQPFADPMFRGILLHRALKALYSQADSGRGIPGSSAIVPAINEALGDSAVRARLTATGMTAERKRLQRILGDWLELDASRQGFTVKELETARRIELNGAEIKVQIDRIDQLDDGRWFLVDYKSSGAGGSRALKWLDARIQEVQLPLYAVLLDSVGKAIGGVSLAAAGYGSKQVGFDGITDDATSKYRGIRQAGVDRGRVKSVDWDQLMAHWRKEIQALLEEILSGHAPNRVYDADAMRFSNLDLVLRQPTQPDDEAEASHGD